MALSTTVYLIIDAGGTFLKSAILTSEGEFLPNSAFIVKSVSDGTKDEILNAFNKIITKGVNYIGNKMKLGGIGVAFPGPFNILQTIPLMKHKFQSIYGLNLRECFYEMANTPHSIPIHFIHDANSVLVGELWKGQAQGFNNAAVVTLGTGLGFAMSRNGEVLCNEIGGPYLSIFKTPFKDGILEDYTAKRGFLKVYRELSRVSDKITVAEIAALAEEGDLNALLTFIKVGEILSLSLHEILNDNQIECLLFSGQISKSFKFMEPALKEGFKNVSCLKQLAVVESIDQAALLGTLKNLLQIESKLNNKETFKS